MASLVQLHVVVDFTKQRLTFRKIRMNRQRQPGINQCDIYRAFIGQRAGDGVQRFCDTGLCRLDERGRFTAGLEAVTRCLDQRVVLGGSQEKLVGFQRFVRAAGALQEAAIGLHHAQRRSGLVVGLPVVGFRLGACRRSDQP
jgi:hypothetical protein